MGAPLFKQGKRPGGGETAFVGVTPRPDGVYSASRWGGGGSFGGEVFDLRGKGGGIVTPPRSAGFEEGGRGVPLPLRMGWRVCLAGG